jgi:hypothetical protein
MKKILALFEAIKKGNELTNKENWKNAAIMTDIFLVLVAAAVIFLPPEAQAFVTPAIKSQIVNGLVSVFGLLSAYTHAATSKSVGF